MKFYKPPFEMNEQIATITAEIAELSGELSAYEGLTTNPILLLLIVKGLLYHF